MNLLKETKNLLSENGKTLSDVLFCVLREEYFYINDFIELADVDYDNGFGGIQIQSDLMLVGADFWLERHEYDGSEWWEYKTLPAKPEYYKKPNSLENKNRW